MLPEPRLAEISRCCDEMARVRLGRLICTSQEDQWGLLLAECDWYMCLHELLYEFDGEQMAKYNGASTKRVLGGLA
jgi:hypothetical protein